MNLRIQVVVELLSMSVAHYAEPLTAALKPLYTF